MAAIGWRTRTIGQVKTTLRALRYPNYRLFYFGQGISLIGTWLQMTALGWLVNRLTGSTMMLGVVGFANRAPSALLTPLAGVLVDRGDKRRIVIWAQALAMLQALALAALALSGQIQTWHVIALSAGLGLVNAIEVPARQSFFVELIDDRRDLSNAIALNSALFNSARLVGPAVAGVLIAAWGEGICFLINGLSYLAVIAALLAISVRSPAPRREHPSVLAELREGLAYALGFEPILALLLLVATVSLLGTPYTVLMPNYATATLHVGARELGLLMASAGFGALCGALYLARRTAVDGLGRLIPLATIVFGVGLTLFGASRDLWLSLVLLPVLSAGMMVQMASANTALQSIVPDDMRGRVISLHVLAFMGTAPLGSLLGGYAARHIGVPATMELGGLLSVLVGLLFLARVHSAGGRARFAEAGLL